MIYQDSSVYFKNYSTPSTIPFNTSVLSDTIDYDLYDASLISKKINLKKLNKEIYYYFMKEYIASSEEYYKNLAGDEYMGTGIDTTYRRSELYFCGKLNLQPGVQSLVILEQEPDNFHRNRFLKSLLLYNIRNNKLCSIISLSMKCAGIDTALNIKSYFTCGKYFTQVKFGEANYDLPAELLNELNLNDENREALYYSKFMVDKNGYIEFLNYK
ncbi:hypothetical protein [Bacteroides sedimenti]|uniref:Uncharacterized protein n=1 Tax=Bacteroides sedimenti TaxID=2136147 RepID=A0ABN6Z2I8_9BACE